tara:strand:+ start:101 stop:322 length:222 start_codon:yes stop_codon:yes gene_type:complete
MSGKNYITSDIAISAYLILRGLKLVSACREPSGKFRFEFLDPDSAAKELAVEYIGSEMCAFDTHLKNLKKLLY